MKTLVSTNNMERDVWLEWRQKGIGGSEAGAILGLNPWMSIIDVYKDKIADWPEEKEDSDAMRLGRDMEDYIAHRWMEETGKKCQRKNAILQHDDHEWMLANIDRDVIGENAGLEIKTTSPFNKEAWADGAVPIYYLAQCQHYMAVTGADRWYLAVLIWPHIEYRVIERSESDIEAIIAAEAEFWQHVMARVMPEPDGSKSAEECIKQMYPEAETGQSVELDHYIADLERYKQLDELIKKTKEEQEAIKQKIQVDMGEAETAYIGQSTVTWKMQKGRKTLDSKRLQKEKPEIYKGYVKEGKPYRVFRVK